MSAAQLFVKADKTDNDMIKRIFTIYVKAQDTRNSNMKPKFFSQISDYPQSMSLPPLRGAYLIPPALLMIADPHFEIVRYDEF